MDSKDQREEASEEEYLNNLRSTIDQYLADPNRKVVLTGFFRGVFYKLNSKREADRDFSVVLDHTDPDDQPQIDRLVRRGFTEEEISRGIWACRTEELFINIFLGPESEIKAKATEYEDERFVDIEPPEYLLSAIQTVKELSHIPMDFYSRFGFDRGKIAAVTGDNFYSEYTGVKRRSEEGALGLFDENGLVGFVEYIDYARKNKPMRSDQLRIGVSLFPSEQIIMRAVEAVNASEGKPD